MSAISRFFHSVAEKLSRQEQSAFSPVGEAIRKELYDKALELIQAGAQFPLIEKDGSSNLLRAIKCFGNIDLIRELVTRADPTTLHQMEEGYSALMEASFYARSDIVELLIARGADIHQANEQGHTPMMMAVVRGINLLDIKKYHLEEEAAISDFLERQYQTARVLVLHGADVTGKAASSANLLMRHYKHSFANPKLISFLIEHGTEPSAVNCCVVASVSQTTAAKVENAVLGGIAARKRRIETIQASLNDKLSAPLQPIVLSYIFSAEVAQESIRGSCQSRQKADF